MTVTPSVAAKKVIGILESVGYEAFAVGGCVRDSILGRVPSDWDVTASARPHEIMEIFADHGECHVIPTGLKHGTVTVVYRGEPVEVTTYRVDGEYADHRRPDSVRFTSSLYEDLARRDFTVNAMAYSPSCGVIDPYGGIDDINAGIIRCVGEPEKRFGEDALRILRALRFASVLGFSIEKSTSDAVLALRASLCHVSRERIFSELSKLLSGKGAAEIIGAYLPVIAEILPQAELDGSDKICVSLKKLGASGLPLLYAALLAHTDAEAVGAIMRSLRADNRTRMRTMSLVSALNRKIADESDIKRLCRDIGTDAAYDVIRLGIARGERDERGLAMIENIKNRGECVSLAGLAVGGNELLSVGAAAKDIGCILNTLLDSVMDGKINNDAAALICAAKQIIDRKEKA